MKHQFNKDPIAHKKISDGDQFIFRFPNNFGASVVCHRYSYGGRCGKWELAVIKFNEDDWEICCSTRITKDVIGWLEVPDVNKLLQRIKRLKSRG